VGDFACRGYYATSLQTIAQRVGITKAAVLYHFPEEADLLSALAAPLLDDLECVLRDAEAGRSRERRWRVIEGLLDAWIAHRSLLRMSLKKMALSAAPPIFERFRGLTPQANVLLARQRAAQAAKVRAAQALAMLGDPVVLFAGAPADDVRAAVLRGVESLLGPRPR